MREDMQCNTGPFILRDEFEIALKELKSNKVTGVDKLNGKLLKALDGYGKDILFRIIGKAYETGIIPKDFEKCIIIPIPKKKKSERCEEYRTISFIIHASKILTKIMHKRIESKINENLAEDQFGFRKNRGTREAIICLRIIIEKMSRINKLQFIAFVDLEKAFDIVKWTTLFKIMEDIGIDYNDKKYIYNLYINEIAVIKAEKGNNQVEAKIAKGVRQTCNLSPTLFNLYIEEALKEVRKENIGVVKIGGILLQMLRFADNIAVIGESDE